MAQQKSRAKEDWWDLDPDIKQAFDGLIHAIEEEEPISKLILRISYLVGLTVGKSHS